jgi:acyl carrier protein
LGDGVEGSQDLVVDLDTSLDTDLELESLEFVALTERLRSFYGDRVDVVAWLGEMELDEIIALTVGDLGELVIEASAGSRPAALAPPGTPSDRSLAADA